jgi:glycosyltransferase involved in cell wall biosynthesis
MDAQTPYHSQFREYRCCVLIPTYNNAQTVAQVIDAVLQYTDQVVVVNDGSTDGTADILKAYNNIQVVTQPANAGKGKALRTGFEKAVELGYQYAITLDSDGQHKATDLPVFLEKLKEKPNAIIIGARNMGQGNVPGTSSFGHKFSNFWFAVETGISLPDTQSGFRLYPVTALKNFNWLTNKYEFEIEVMVRSAWAGIDITYVPIDVYYPPKGERITHFRLFRDFTRISILNTFLVVLALLYGRPAMLYWKLKKKSVKRFIYENLLNSNEPDHKIAGAVSLGVFWGITPIWGYQWAAALFVAHFIRLNKVITYTATNISIPPMIPLILFLSIQLGGLFISDAPAMAYNSTINLESIKAHMLQYIIGSMLLACIASILSGIATYVLIRAFRKREIVPQNSL